MVTIDDLHERLRVTAVLLDSAASDIRDLELAPPKENIRHIGEALVHIFDIMRAIYALRPDLKPAALEPGPGSEANKRLTYSFGKAIALAEGGDVSAAIELLSSYAESEDSQHHRSIALNEIDRLRSRT